MPKKPKSCQSDINTFQEAVKGVKPLIHNKIRLTPLIKSQKQIHHPVVQEEIFHFSDSDYLPTVHGDEFISYKHIGVSNKTLRKLSKGQYNVGAILDLHGMTIDKARTNVDLFLQECLRDRIRVGLIIHGKGRHLQMPILKNKLNHWLRQTNTVLAFCSAAPGHGSHGATYVLFKRLSEENSVE